MATFAGWIGRYALLLVLLFLAGLGYTIMTGRYGSVWSWPERAMQDGRQLQAASEVLAADVKRFQTQTRTSLDARSLRSTALIDARLRAVAEELEQRRAEDRGAGSIATQLLRGGGQEIVRVHRNRLVIRALEIETGFLVVARRPAETLAQYTDWEKRAREEFHQRRSQCRALYNEADKLEHDWFWRRYEVGYFHVRNKVSELRAHASVSCRSAASLKSRYVQIEVKRREVSKLIGNLPTQAGAYAGMLSDVETSLKEGWLFSAKLWLRAHHARTVLRAAIIGVVLAMLMPFAIRILFFSVLAPIAARRPAIRLLPDSAPMAPDHKRPAVSLDVAVPRGWELLVKQGYLHRAPIGAKPSTRWLLSLRQPVASFIRKLTFLTRYRDVPDQALATISVGNEPFAEVTLLRLEEGQACMLQPRLIVAVLQPVDRPMRISGHWRLTSLQAWLTAQLRFLVFHGPAMLVLKGARGLHMVAADHDLDLPADHVVGFSANLSYGVTRAATFQPYFFGREALLRDAVRRGPGIVVLEEGPALATEKAAHGPSHRLENTLDVVLKFFGL